MSSSFEAGVRFSSELSAFNGLMQIFSHCNTESRASTMEGLRGLMIRLEGRLEEGLPQSLRSKMEPNLTFLNQAIKDVDFEGIKKSLSEIEEIIKSKVLTGKPR